MDELVDFDIKVGLKYLLDGYVIKSVNSSKVIYFVIKEDKVISFNDGYKAKMSQEDFIELYRDSSFNLVEEEYESIDVKRDEEYYRWRSK